MQQIHAEQGWFLLHCYYRINRERWHKQTQEKQMRARECFRKVIENFRKFENCQIHTYTVLGHKADFGILIVDPELNRLNQTENDILNSFPDDVLQPVHSFFSMSEVSDYVTQTDDYDRTLREKEGLSPDSSEYQKKMEAFKERIQFYINDRLYPQIPEHKLMCFYPMNKARGEHKNWYALDFEARKRLMAGHLVTGRKFAGKVKQLITGSAGLDAWEWGVTLFVDDPYYLKKIIYEMRFDEVSAVYGEFGDFLVGICLEPKQVFERLKL